MKERVKIGRFGDVGEVLAEDPWSVVETGPGGVGRRWKKEILTSLCSGTRHVVFGRLVSTCICLVSCRGVCGGVCVG